MQFWGYDLCISGWLFVIVRVYLNPFLFGSMLTMLAADLVIDRLASFHFSFSFLIGIPAFNCDQV